MILKIANDNRSIIKKGVYLFSLVEYPKIQDWEWNNILAFISYEKAHGDILEIVCENEDILSVVQDAADKLDGREYIPPIADAIKSLFTMRQMLMRHRKYYLVVNCFLQLRLMVRQEKNLQLKEKRMVGKTLHIFTNMLCSDGELI